MRNKELNASLAALRRILADPRLGTAHLAALRKGQRELESIRKSGKLDQRKVFRAVSLISSTLAEMLLEPEHLTTPCKFSCKEDE
jgi:hypothetical protein